MRASNIALCAALALLLGVAAVQAAGYSCPATCTAKLGCQCATSKPPTGIANGEMPQFIVLTNDDAITVISQPIIMNITERHTNKNGCKMPATWFTSIQYTDPNLVKQVFIRGHEIATHTVNHVANPNATEIVGARDWLNKTAGIPLESIRGFRSPFLMYNPEQRAILSKAGFTWDSSISEQYPSDTSPSSAELLFPYTMDYGVPQNCAISTGTCSLSERLPGLWEFPMHNIQDATGATVASMDPLGDPLELFTRGFDQRYNGNRAPMGIFIHAAWLIADPTRADKLNQFLEYAMTKENVFLVTVNQVLEWMQNPVPAAEYSPNCPSEQELLALLPQGSSLCVMPNQGCDYGVFDSNTCKCKCQNEEINAAGYCRDADERCTVQKSYDFDFQKYYCPEPVTTPVAVPSTAPTAGGATAPIVSGTQPLTVEMDVSGSSVVGFQTTQADAFCAQLLRLTGDAAATCKVVSVVTVAATPAVANRRLLAGETVHVITSLESKNAEAAVAALQTDTVFTLLAPAGITVVPGSVKAALGAYVAPAPVVEATPTPTDSAATPVDAAGNPTDSAPAASGSDTAAATDGSSSSGGGSSIGPIVGGVVGGLAAVAIIVGAVVVMRRRKAAAAASTSAADAQIAARTASYNPTFGAGVTATVRTSRSPTKKGLMEAEAVTDSPLRDSMARQQS